MYLLQPQPYKLQKPLCLQRATAGSALMQQSDMQGSRSCWPSKCYEVLGATMFYRAEADWDMFYKTANSSVSI